MKILLVYPPFCTPASPPYSVTNLHSKLKDSEVLDLNLEFHKLMFPIYEEYYQKGEWKDYDLLTTEYHRKTSITYAKNNRKVINGKKPEFFDILLEKIKEKKADIIAFSVVYSSQTFYTHALLKELKNTVVGGPAVNKKLIDLTDKTLDIPNTDLPLKFKNVNEYFVPNPVIPIKTSSTCFYKKCSFCTHYTDSVYCEYDLENIKETIVNSKQKYFFLIDDMIPTKRLLKIAEMMKPLNVKWTCQLKPTSDLNYEVLKELKESGLSFIMWGVESGSDRILTLMNKGTNKKDISKVLTDSHKAGIKNMIYIILGFPTETKEEFLETIGFLEKNEKNIDLVLTSIFGLQKGSEIYKNPKKFGIINVIEEKRTLLEPKISYKTNQGLTQKEAKELRKKYKKTIDKINKYPKAMNFFREHMFFV
ncbi:MAG: B12-binding domain-containing radical SAM protein [archaeon]